MANIRINATTLNNASKDMAVLDDIMANPRLAAMLQDMQNNVYQPNTYMSQPIMNTQAMTGASDIGGYKAPLSTVLGNTINPYDSMSVPVNIPQSQQAPLNLTLGNKIDPYADMRVPVDIPSITEEEAKAQIATLTQQPKAQQPMQPTSQAKAQQQAMPTQPQIKQAIAEKKRELSLLELFGKGMADALKDPVTSTGKTNTLYDMLRGAMAVQAPQQSAIMEQEIKGLQDTETARVNAEAELLKQQQDFTDKVLLEQVKAKLKDQEGMTSTDKRFANTLIESTLKDKFIEGYKDTLKEAKYIKTVVASGSSYSLDTIITKLVRMSGDPRVSDEDRLAYQNALGLFQGLDQKTRKLIEGGKVEKGSPAYESIMKLTNSLEQVSANGLRKALNATEERLVTYGYKPEWSNELMKGYYGQYDISDSKDNIVKTSDGSEYKIISVEG